MCFLFSTLSHANSEINPFIKGSFLQIQQAHSNQATIITFWSQSCDFCMKELALLGKLLKDYPSINLVSISTDPFLKPTIVNNILSSKNLIHFQKWVFADDYVERLYFDVEKTWRGELPLTYFLNKDNTLHKKLGVIKEDKLIHWLKNQSLTASK